MNMGILFAMITAIAFGFWTLFHKLAAPHIDKLLGAVIVSATAAIIGLVFLLPNMRSETLLTDTKGIVFTVLAGISAITIDYFALKTYGSNLSVSIAWPIIMGGSIAIAAILWFFIGETITAIKLLGILLIIAGTIILSTVV